jgi:hypothetical protein
VFVIEIRDGSMHGRQHQCLIAFFNSVSKTKFLVDKKSNNNPIDEEKIGTFFSPLSYFIFIKGHCSFRNAVLLVINVVV